MAVRLMAPNGVITGASENKVALLVAAGYKPVATAAPVVSEKAEVPSPTETPVKRKPGRPRKAVALPAPKPEKTDSTEQQ